jgi:hypothetical protein
VVFTATPPKQRERDRTWEVWPREAQCSGAACGLGPTSATSRDLRLYAYPLAPVGSGMTETLPGFVAWLSGRPEKQRFAREGWLDGRFVMRQPPIVLFVSLSLLLTVMVGVGLNRNDTKQRQ